MNQVGRNDPCPCGSGKKSKQCCQGSRAGGLPVRMSPAEVAYCFQTACTFYEHGRLGDADGVLQQLLSSAPTHVDALHLGGLVAYQLGRPAEGARLIAKSVKLNPRNPDAFNNLGLAKEACGEFAEAVSSYRQSLRLNGAQAHVHSNLGNALVKLGECEHAIASFERALAIQADFAPALNGLGNAWHGLMQLPQAIDAYRRAIAIQPGHFQAMCNLGQVLREHGDRAAAEASFRQAISVAPDHAPAYSQLGDLLALLKQDDAAEECLCRAIALDPDFPGGYINLANLFTRRGRVAEAESLLETLNNRQPGIDLAYASLGGVQLELGRVKEASVAFRRAVQLRPDNVAHFSNLLMALHYQDDLSPEQILAEHQAFARRFEAPLRKVRAKALPPQPEERLKVGFVSGDFREHPVGYFIESVLGALKGGALDVVLYPTTHTEDALSARLKALGWPWRSLAGVSDARAVEMIAEDGIHILVDLSGHTAGNRLMLFALRPAPKQVSWLGYWASTGLRCMDYVISDRYSLPAQEQDQYTEKVAYLPDSRFCFTPPDVDVPVAELPALRHGALTFGSFNSLAKLGPKVISLWTEVLQAVPGSRLLCKAVQLGDETVCARLKEQFMHFGISADRLILEGPSPRDAYLATYNRVDIVLDPFPFSGGTTSVEGLWMGVPFITRRGDRMISHQGESLLYNLSMADWIAEDEADYVALAVKKSRDLHQLAELRQQLRQRLLVSPLCNAEHFSQHLVELLWRIWHGTDQAPASNGPHQDMTA